MIKGVRRPDEVAALGLSQRLLVRVGALLKKSLAITVPVLESARPGSPLENLLLAPAMLEQAAALNVDALRALAQEHAGVNASLYAVVAADDGVKVICLQEEVDAGEGWGSAGAASSVPLPACPAVPPTPAAASSETALARPALYRAAPAAEGLFTRPEIERWRLKLVTAAAVADRGEALRTLFLAPLSPAEKLDVVLQGLADKDAALRAEAAGLLSGLGADNDFASALAALNHAEAARQMAAVDRLRKFIETRQSTETSAGGEARELEVGAIVVCGLSMLRYQADPALTAPLLDLLRGCAAAVGRNSERLAEVVRIMLGLLASTAKQKAAAGEVEALQAAAHRLMDALAAAVPKALQPVLMTEHERCADMAGEAFLLQALLDVTPPGDESEPKLLRQAVSYIGRDTEEGRGSRAVGARLVRRGEPALLALCEGFAAGHPGAQRYFLILLDDIYRLFNVPPAPLGDGGKKAITPAALDRAAQVVLRTIETGTKGVRMAAMECRFIADLDVPEETRQRLARLLLGYIADFTFRSEIEKVESLLSRMGLPVMPPLIERLGVEWPAHDRVRAVRLLGDWALNVRAPKGQIARLQEAVTEVLRRLQALSLDEEFPDRGELLCALGKLAASPAASKDADAVITRRLLDAAKSTDAALAPRAMEGLAHVAASRRAQADLVHATAELLRHALEEMTAAQSGTAAGADVQTTTSSRNGETVIEFTGGERYTRVLPVLLLGMSRVACSSSCPPMVMRELVKTLLARWKSVCRGELIWGPANTRLLIQALRDLGCHKGLPTELRLEILKGFAPRHTQTPIMHALTAILEADDTPATAVGAVTIGYAILGRRGKDGQFPAEDREDILQALARIVGRRMLGAGSPEAQQQTAALRRLVIEELFKGVSDTVPHAYELLAGLRVKTALPEESRMEIDRRLKAYEALAVQ